MRLPPSHAAVLLAAAAAVSATAPMASASAHGAAVAAAACPIETRAESPPRPVATGLRFAEGPAWTGRDWLLSDVAANRRHRLSADGSALTVQQEPSGYANGNALLPDGSVVSARHDRRVVRVAPDGTEAVLAERRGGSRLNSPNDVAVAPDGAVWFTDPTFGIEGYGPERAAPEQPVRGVYRLPPGAAPGAAPGAGAAEPELATGALAMPNGLAFDAARRVLYMNDTASGVVHRLPLGPDWRPVGEPAAFARGEPGVDGLRVDAAGRVWVAGPKGVAVYAPDGARLCALPLEAEHVSNLALGGADGRDVLVTATDRAFLLRATERLLP